jgi:vacuolar protein sorting-associated protein 29
LSLQDTKLPETKVITIGAFKIGLCHGHQVVPWGDAEALAALRREVTLLFVWLSHESCPGTRLGVAWCFQLDVDILVSGHTHQNSVIEYEEKFFINPGSITGAFSTTSGCVYRAQAYSVCG